MVKKVWTDERKQDLLEYLSKDDKTYASAAKHFKTTEKAILSVLDRMGSRNIPDIRGWISAIELVSYFGYDKNAMYRLETAGYKFKIYANGRYTTIPEFWAFIKDHKDFFQLDRLERGVLVPEPDWLDDYIETQNPRRRKEWTSREIALLKHLYYQEEWNCIEIGRELNRTPRSIRAKIARLAKQEMNKIQEVCT